MTETESLLFRLRGLLKPTNDDGVGTRTWEMAGLPVPTEKKKLLQQVDQALWTCHSLTRLKRFNKAQNELITKERKPPVARK